MSRVANDCFALPPGVHWTPADEALALLKERMETVVGVEDAPLAQADGRVLAEDILAAHSSPPADNSAVDGYAYVQGSGAEGRYRLLAGRAAAGAPYDGVVTPGAALRIFTGAVLPKGADTVIMQEGVSLEEGYLRFDGGPKTGANVRAAGEDVAAGEIILSAGQVLRPQDVAQAATMGVDRLKLRRRLRVAVLSTGDELAQPGDAPGEGGIFDANRPMLAALAARMGSDVVDLGVASDDPVVVRDALGRGADRADAIIASGGASGGDEDHVSAVLGDAGARTLWRIAIKPGRPLALGVWDGAPVFGLPGNPVAAFVCFLIFARPALMVMAGADWPEPRRLKLPAGFEKRKKGGRREFLRGRIGADGRVEAFRSEGSGLISGLRWAEGLIDLPEAAAEIRHGDPVAFLPFSELGL